MSRTTPTAATSHVVIVGRLGARVDHRVLPSGDALTTFTVVVDREPARGEHPGPRVDAIACRAERAGIARRVAALAPGTWVRVEGPLRRRFWRTPGGAASATEVQARVLVRAQGPRASMSG